MTLACVKLTKSGHLHVVRREDSQKLPPNFTLTPVSLPHAHAQTNIEKVSNGSVWGTRVQIIPFLCKMQPWTNKCVSVLLFGLHGSPGQLVSPLTRTLCLCRRPQSVNVQLGPDPHAPNLFCCHCESLCLRKCHLPQSPTTPFFIESLTTGN